MPIKPKEPDILRTAKQVVALLAKSGLCLNDQYRVVCVVESALPDMRAQEPIE